MMHTCRHYLDIGKAIASAKSTSAAYELGRLLLYRLITGYGPDHYTTYFLFNKPVNVRKWREYVDKKDFCRILFRYNRKNNFKDLEDKVEFAEKCLRYDLPHPTIRFTVNYTRQTSGIADVQCADIAAAFDALSTGDYIVKTCTGSYGFNLWSITRTAAGIQVHNDNSLQSPEQFAEQLLESGESYLVQDKIEVSRGLRAIMPGLACGSIRVVTFLRADGSVVTPFVLIKPTTVGPVCDNFSDGSSGNMLAVIDSERQCIVRVVRKAANGLLEDISHHPDTGVDLRNYHFPQVTAALDLAHDCARCFAETPAVAWDIVVTDQGAMVLEGNPMFDPIGPQLCADRGVRDIIPRLLQA